MPHPSVHQQLLCFSEQHGHEGVPSNGVFIEQEECWEYSQDRPTQRSLECSFLVAGGRRETQTWRKEGSLNRKAGFYSNCYLGQALILPMLHSWPDPHTSEGPHLPMGLTLYLVFTLAAGPTWVTEYIRRSSLTLPPVGKSDRGTPLSTSVSSLKEVAIPPPSQPSATWGSCQ